MSDEARGPGDVFTEIEHEAARLWNRPVHEIADWATRAQAEVESGWSSKIQEWKLMAKAEYGCWCGPGNRCLEDKDAMDACCHKHDDAYTALNIDHQSMWSAAAIVVAREADRNLANCMSAGSTADLDSEAMALRDLTILVFNGRADLGDYLAGLQH